METSRLVDRESASDAVAPGRMFTALSELYGGTGVAEEQKSLPCKDKGSLSKIGGKSLPISCLFRAPTASNAAQVESTPSNRQGAGRKEVKLELATHSK